MEADGKDVAAALAEDGYCICRGGVAQKDVAKARSELDAALSKGILKPGGFTIGGRDGAVSAKRDDKTMWLHEHLWSVGGPDKAGMGMITALDRAIALFGEAVFDALSKHAGGGKTKAKGRRRTSLSSKSADGSLCFCGRTDMMLACYPGNGAAYGPHIDNADGDGREGEDYGRCLTLVYYLQEERWDSKVKGGALRMHLPPPDGDGDGDGGGGGSGGGEWPSGVSPSHTPHSAVDVEPIGDTLVLFRADRMLHEGLPSKAPRFAMTVWLYGGSAKDAERYAAKAQQEEEG